MDNLIMVYHEQTNTHWVNDLNWEERHKTEKISYGTIELETEDYYMLFNTMKNDGFYLIPNEIIPWKHLGKIKEDNVYKGLNIFQFE